MIQFENNAYTLQLNSKTTSQRKLKLSRPSIFTLIYSATVQLNKLQQQ